ncbi:MAG TPA: CCA tRNA nucleotidyltransferase [Rhabdochlamydiaceae bacterium]|nr:CCA tRNA nucleotidyltransferase [Rhabdochlamydiaceae bacterium]
MPAIQHATAVVKKLVEHGFIAYFAGGWVRDFLMQRPSDDIDIATSATTDDIQRIFPKTIPVGVAFGIVIVVQDHFQFEVATFRKDRGYVDGRRPTGIDPATPEEDAQRRDFTINGMFYDPLKEKLYDYVDGEKDIELGIIRAIGSPHERFAEDRLRMMRAVRYSTRFNFPIEIATLQAILAHSGELLSAVAIERIWQEFKKMSQFAHFNRGLISLHHLNLLPTIFPALKEISIEEVQRLVQFIPRFPKNSPTFAELLDLFPHYSLEQVLDLCDYLKLSNSEKEFARFYHHAKNLLNMPEEWLKKLEKAEWAQFYANPHAELCIKIIACHYPIEKEQQFVKAHEKRRQSLEKAILRIQTKNPVVRAEHLMKEGITPGEKMGKLLKEAERLSVNENLEDPLAAIKLLKQSSFWHLK